MTLPELPNGPAKVTTDLKKDRFKIDYAGDPLFQATLRVLRNGDELPLKDAAVRLFVISKSEGWDIVTQTVRVTAVAVQSGDLLVLRGYTSVDDGRFGLSASPGGEGVYSLRQDWLLAANPGEWFCEEVKPRKAETAYPRYAVASVGAEILFTFKPRYRNRHLPASILQPRDE